MVLSFYEHVLISQIIHRPGSEVTPDYNSIASLPTAFLSDDPVSQSHIYNVLQTTQRNRAVQSFKTAPVTNISLSTLIKIYNQKDSKASIELLKTRKQLHIDPEFVIDGDDPSIVWKAQNTGAVDFLCCVPDQPGFGAVLPNPPSGTSHEYSMDFTKLHKEFKAKHAHLNFDPAHRMLYIGRFAGQELWGAWISKDWFTDEKANTFDTGYTSGDTRMAGDIARWTILFLAFVMQQKGIGSVTCQTRHPKTLESYADLRKCTDLV